MKLSPSLHRIGSDLVNVYLVEDDTGITVIDAGLSGQWADLVSELTMMGRTIDDIRGLVLTHGDTDHIGFAERLRADHDVPVYVHELDAARARGEDKKDIGWGKVKVGPLLRFFWYGARRGGLRTQPVSELVTFTDGETLDLPAKPRVIHIPGHTPGSAAIHVPHVDALFVGDALTTGHVLTGEIGPRPAPFTLDPSQAIDSLNRLETIRAKWVLPGHGAPWSGGVGDAIAQVREVAFFEVGGTATEGDQIA
ncbi:MAG TPA: MBL fold metallo-hydrolase [Acidimicrobiia bacterium]|nr:MBL fold metallo-hydrolase [Acidimicrobiia bacterium]